MTAGTRRDGRPAQKAITPTKRQAQSRGRRRREGFQSQVIWMRFASKGCVPSESKALARPAEVCNIMPDVKSVRPRSNAVAPNNCHRDENQTINLSFIGKNYSTIENGKSKGKRHDDFNSAGGRRQGCNNSITSSSPTCPNFS